MAEHRGGRWHRFLLSVMGPAQVGPYDSAEPVTDTSACPRCGEGWAAHDTVRTERRSYVRCPEG